MKLTATGAADGNLVLFWPESLPAGAEARFVDEPVEVAEQLREEGKLIWFTSEAVGQYRLEVFIREQLPEELHSLCVEEEKYELSVRGVGYFGDLDFLSQQRPGPIPLADGHCQQVVIPDGRYTATILRCDHAEDKWARWIASHTSKSDRLQWRLEHILMSATGLGVLATIGSFFFVSWPVWGSIAGATVGCFLAAKLLARSAGYARVLAAVDEHHRTFPEFVVHLE